MIQQIDRRIVRSVVTLPDDVQRAYEPSRLFDDGVPEYAQIETAAVTAYPFTMACHFYTNSITTSQALMWVGDKDSAVHFCSLNAQGTIGGDPLIAFSHTYGGAAFTSANTTTGFSANVWHHGVGVWVSATERYVYIDGGSKGSDATEVEAIANHDRTAIGGARDSSADLYVSGRIFWPGIWNNVALTDAEAAALGNRAKPTPPWEIRPESIVSMPNMRTLWDPYMKALWTPAGTVPANPPWLWRPRHVSMYVPAAVGNPWYYYAQAS